MAHRILDAGFPLTVHARRPVQAVPLVERGAAEAASLAELAAASELLAVCVGDDAGVEQVCANALPSLAPGSLLVVHSTVAPATCLRIGEAARPRSVEVVDAPVSGGRTRAFEGALTVLVGGAPAAVARARPVLDAFAALVLHLGPLGAGSTVKLVNNYLFAAQIGLLGDTVRLVTDLGLDVRPALTAIAASTGSSRAAEFFVAGDCAHVVPRHQDGRARGAELLAKDIALFDERASGTELPKLLDRAARTGLELFRSAAEDERRSTTTTPE